MSKVVLHIGTHKTATTTVQDTFWENAPLLAEHGLIYPRLGRVTGHHGLVFDWGQLPDVYRLKEGSRGALAALAKAHGGGEDTVFLSSEEFSRADPQGAVDFAEVRELLSPFDRIEVICTLRPQWEFLQSVYLELAKKRVPPRPPQLVKPVIAKGLFAGLYVDYNLLLDRLETVFAPEEITFLDFRASQQAPGGILGRLLTHLGVDLPFEALNPVNGGKSNVSPMALASWMANTLAEPKVAPPWLVASASELLHNRFGQGVKSCLFTRGEFRYLKKNFEAANARLQERRAAVQPDFALSVPDEEALSLFRNDVSADIWMHFARRVVAPRL